MSFNYSFILFAFLPQGWYGVRQFFHIMYLFLRNFWELHNLTLTYTTFVYINIYLRLQLLLFFKEVNTGNCSHTQPFLKVMWYVKNSCINLPESLTWADWNQSCVGLTSHQKITIKYYLLKGSFTCLKEVKFLCFKGQLVLLLLLSLLILHLWECRKKWKSLWYLASLHFSGKKS